MTRTHSTTQLPLVFTRVTHTQSKNDTQIICDASVMLRLQTNLGCDYMDCLGRQRSDTTSFEPEFSQIDEPSGKHAIKYVAFEHLENRILSQTFFSVWMSVFSSKQCFETHTHTFMNTHSYTNLWGLCFNTYHILIQQCHNNSQIFCFIFFFECGGVFGHDMIHSKI